MNAEGLGKVLVTGGGGFLGTALARTARARGLPVRSLSRRLHPQLDVLEVEQVQGDVSELRDVSRAVAGCDTVFHTAAKAGLWGPHAEYERINVAGTENVIAACRAQGAGASSTPVLRAWFSTATRWKARMSRPHIPCALKPPIRGRRLAPSRS